MTERFLRPDEIDALCALYEDCKRSEHTAWCADYPDRDCAEADLRDAAVCALFDGETLAAAVTLEKALGELAEYDWPDTLKSPAEFTRLGVRPAYQGKGLARRLLNFALRTAKRQGSDGVRLMVLTTNPRAVALYQNAGFLKVRQVFAYENDYFLEELPLTFTCNVDRSAI